MSDHATNIDDCNVPADFVWGVREIGRVIGLNKRQTQNLLETGQLKCPRKIGKRWMASKAALIRELTA